MRAGADADVILIPPVDKIMAAGGARSRVIVNFIRRQSGLFFFFSRRRRHTSYWRDWSSDVCSSDLGFHEPVLLSLAFLNEIRDGPADVTQNPEQIGRASCRERVKIEVVSVS